MTSNCKVINSYYESGGDRVVNVTVPPPVTKFLIIAQRLKTSQTLTRSDTDGSVNSVVISMNTVDLFCFIISCF